MIKYIDKFLLHGLALTLSFLSIFAIFKFHDYMDNYEIGILVGATILFSWLSKTWLNFGRFFIASLILSFISIYIYQGNLIQAEDNFFFKILSL